MSRPDFSNVRWKSRIQDPVSKQETSLLTMSQPLHCRNGKTDSKEGYDQPRSLSQLVTEKSGLQVPPSTIQEPRGARGAHGSSLWIPPVSWAPGFLPGLWGMARLPALRVAAFPAALLCRPVRALAGVVPAHKSGLWLPPLVPPLLGWPSLFLEERFRTSCQAGGDLGEIGAAGVGAGMEGTVLGGAFIFILGHELHLESD